jgi:hypothetical protein
MSVTRCISAILGTYFSFISIKIGREPFFLLQFLLHYLKWHGQSIKYYCPSWREGWTSLVSSHIGYLMDKGDSNTYPNFKGTQSSRVVGSIEGNNKLTTNYTVQCKLKKIT